MVFKSIQAVEDYNSQKLSREVRPTSARLD